MTEAKRGSLAHFANLTEQFKALDEEYKTLKAAEADVDELKDECITLLVLTFADYAQKFCEQPVTQPDIPIQIFIGLFDELVAVLEESDLAKDMYSPVVEAFFIVLEEQGVKFIRHDKKSGSRNYDGIPL